MRFWKFVKDDLEEAQNQQSQNDNSQESEKQKLSNDSQQQGDGESEPSQPQDDNSKQNQGSSEQPNNAEESEEQDLSNNSSQQGDGEEQQGSSENNEEQQRSNSLPQQSDSVEGSPQQQQSSSEDTEEQQMNNGTPQQSGGQERMPQPQSGSPENRDEQQKSNSSSQQSGGQEESPQPQDNNPKQNQSSSEQPSGSENSEEQQMSVSTSQQSDEETPSTKPQEESSKQSKDSSEQPSDLSEDELSQNKDEKTNESKSDNTDKTNEAPSQEQIEQMSNDIANNPKLTPEQKKQLYEKLKKSIAEMQKRKAEKLHEEHLKNPKQEVEESPEEKYELSEQTNKFLDQLGELPSFEERERGPGYSIDTESYTDVPDSVIRTLITKFLNQRFCNNNTDLNVRSNSLEKTKGFHKWEIKDVIVHLKTHQVTKVLTDKYGYEYEQGKSEDVPLSFYFDMSGSMSSYTNMLAVIAIELLKKGVKVLIGFNERVNVQIESIEKNITVSELAEILESAGYMNSWGRSGREDFKKDPRVKFKYIERNLDNYLIDKKAEKCVVFADFDPRREVINLSQFAEVYWFCFERRYTSYNLGDFNGFIYKVGNIKDLEQGLLLVNKKRFETLCYIDNPSGLKRK